MKALFRDLYKGQLFKTNPYELTWSEKVDDKSARMRSDLGKEIYRNISPNAEVIILNT